jgi:hypothetical protein
MQANSTWSSNRGDWPLPSSEAVPAMRTVVGRRLREVDVG